MRENEKPRGWQERHPLLFYWTKRGSWATLAAFATWLFYRIHPWFAIPDLSIQIPTPLWVLILLVVLVGACAVAISVHAIRRLLEPACLRFIHAEYFGMRWRWQYANDDPLHAAPHYPKCDSQLTLKADAPERGNVPKVQFECLSFWFGADVTDHSYEEVQRLVQIFVRKQMRKLGGAPCPV